MMILVGIGAQAHASKNEAENSQSTVGSALVAPDRVIAALDLVLIWIKPGSFIMGSAGDEAGRHSAEGPRTTVTLTDGFWLGKTPVTQKQYEMLTGKNPSHFKAVGGNAPVEEVSWIEAMAFCATLTERERLAGRLPAGYVYTLPTEAQWEYACRAGTTDAYVGDPDSIAWHNGNSGGTTHPVATKEANPWGLHDMTGNILEWCFDWYGPYPGGEVTDPTGPKTGYYRMARGGCWNMGAEVCRSAARAGGSAGRQDYTLGFRIALSKSRSPN